MAKGKHAKPEEFYLGTIRSLKKENAQLRKKVKQLESLINPSIEIKPKESKSKENLCPECGKNGLQEIEFIGKLFDVCQICDYKSKVKRAYKRK